MLRFECISTQGRSVQVWQGGTIFQGTIKKVTTGIHDMKNFETVVKKGMLKKQWLSRIETAPAKNRVVRKHSYITGLIKTFKLVPISILFLGYLTNMHTHSYFISQTAIIQNSMQTYTLPQCKHTNRTETSLFSSSWAFTIWQFQPTKQGWCQWEAGKAGAHPSSPVAPPQEGT